MHFPYKEHTFLLDDKTFENIEIFLKHKDNLEILNEQNTDIEVENSCGPRCPIYNVIKDLLECPRSSILVTNLLKRFHVTRCITLSQLRIGDLKNIKNFRT